MLLNSALLDREHVVGRMKTIELLEKGSPYRNGHHPVERRFEQALAMIPNQHRGAALFLFSTVFYVSQGMMEEAWRSLWFRAQHNHGIGEAAGLAFMLELDGGRLKDELFHAIKSPNRIALNLPIRSAADVIDEIMRLEEAQAGDVRHSALVSLYNTPTWILLTDIALSGTSLVSELKRLKQLQTLFGGTNRYRILCLCQVATQTAIDAVCLHSELSDIILEVGIRVPNSNALVHADYNLLRSPEQIKASHELCRWFAENHIVGSGYRLEQLAEEHKDPAIARYGFGGLGWSVVTHNNAPNNALPILWFRPRTDRYRPPFERIDSRIGTPVWGERGPWLERALSGKRFIQPDGAFR